MIIVSLLFWLCVVAGVVALLVHLSGRHHRLQLKPDAIHFATTEDGWRLTISRYRARDSLGAPPVVLCPGAGMGSVIFDVSEETSLARYLTSHGHDVWLLDLRGRPSRPRRRANWSFDDYVEFDIPAALRTICEQSGSSQVQWVGFGVGALVQLAALAGPEAGRVRSLLALAAPVFFRRQQATIGPRLLRWLRLLRLDILARLGAPLLGRLYPGPLKLLQNRDNVDGDTYRRALINALAGFSRAELLQYAEWLEHDSFTATVQRRDYRASMGSIDTPTLFIVGPRDELAPPDMVEATANLLEEVEDRAVVVASRMHGMSTNYGHLDLLLGRAVQRDIFTHILKWLDLHAGVEIPGTRPEPPEPREGWSDEQPYPRREPVSREEPRELLEDEPLPAGLDEEDEDDLDEDDLVQGDVPRVPG